MTTKDELFENFWRRAVPFPFSHNAKLKAKAIEGFSLLLKEIEEWMTTPNAIGGIIAAQKIARMLIQARLIANDPNPDPEAVVAAVQALIDRLKNQEPGGAPNNEES